MYELNIDCEFIPAITAIAVLWEITTPFGLPVVPLVYEINQIS